MPKSAHGNDDEKRALIGQLGNLALLEKRINKDMGSKSFATKSHLYSGSDFHLTQALANESEWTAKQIQARTARFAELACIAWPAT